MKKRILICDDDEGTLGLMGLVLKEKGYSVKMLLTGRGIKKTIQSFSPHVLLLDMWMPRLKGNEIIIALKKDKKTKDLPIVVVSALSDAQKLAQDAGADNFLAKPFEMNEFLDIVKIYL